MKAYSKWDLSKGKTAERWLRLSKWLTVFLMCANALIGFLWFREVKESLTVVLYVHIALFALFYGLLVAETLVWQRNKKCEDFDSIKHKAAIPKGSVRVLSVKNGARIKADMPQHLSLEDAARTFQIPYDHAAFAILGDGYLHGEEPTKTLAEVVGDGAYVYVIDVNGEPTDGTPPTSI